MSLIKSSIMGQEHDYTKGSIKIAIVLLAIPMILELSLESVFAVVDIFFVGRLGENAIAVVGYTETMITIVYSVAIGMSTAATALIARRIGEKDSVKASEASAQILMIAAWITVLLSIGGVLLAGDILRFMGATEEVVKEGIVFTRIMFGSSGVIMYLFLINGIFRGAGNASMAMKSLWIASLANIILDPILIYGLAHFQGFGLKGAAIATCIGRGLGVLFQLVYLLKGKGDIVLKKSLFVPNWSVIKTIITLAWPATFQFIIASGSWIVLTRLIAETGGTTASAAYQIAIRNFVFFILPAWGLSNAAATMVGQNLGAKDSFRAEQSVRYALKYNIIFMVFVSILFISFAPYIIAFFSDSQALIAIGTKAMRIIGSGFVFYGIAMVAISALNGAGDTRTPTIINFIGYWLFQIPLAYFLSKYLNLGIDGIMYAIPISETAVALAAWYYFRKGKWKKILI